MTRTITTILFPTFCFASIHYQPALAAKKGDQPGKHLKITEVMVDSDSETITIVLEDLDFGPGPLVVRLGDESMLGDITVACTADTGSTPQTIVCDFSETGLDTGLPPDGDYLLIVATGAGQSQSDEYDLTIGNPVLAGQSCPPGQFLTGFDSSGNIVCSGLAACGDGQIDPGEACDDGNTIPGDGCSASCQLESGPVCGNAVVESGEICDDGGNSATCDSDCTSVACGDNFVNPAAGEECDTGGGYSATCTSQCTLSYCGDLIVNDAAGEECDYGGESAFCDSDCTSPVCGDLYINPLAGEECDDGNNVNGDGCSADCQSEETTACLSDDDCAAGSFCDTNNQCVAKQANGSVCSVSSECVSGSCTDGYCCDRSCTATCESCGILGSVGVCQFALAYTDPRVECGASNACDGAGSCKARDGEACTQDADCISGNCSLFTCES